MINLKQIQILNEKSKEYEKINRKLTKSEWEEIEKYIEEIEIENGYIQELGEHEEEYVPNWQMND